MKGYFKCDNCKILTPTQYSERKSFLEKTGINKRICNVCFGTAVRGQEAVR